MKYSNVILVGLVAFAGAAVALSAKAESNAEPAADASVQSADGAPKVVQIFPENGATNVDADLKSLRIVFDRPMSGGYSLCRGKGVSWNCHPTIGTRERPKWSEDRKSITFPMDLRPGRMYKASLNWGRANNFKSAEGVPLKNLDYVFYTRGTAESDPRYPHVVSIVPANGAQNVDPGTSEIVITFDRPMREGRSVARSNQGTWNDFPKVNGQISLDETKKVFTVPVSLEPGKTYKLQLNNGNACGFASEEGFCLEDYPYSFTTGGSNTCAEVVKGVVGLSLYPSIEDIALAYDKSPEDDLFDVATREVKSRLEDREKISLAGKAVVELQTLCGFKTIRSAVVDDNGNYVTEIMDDDPDCRVFCKCETEGVSVMGSAHIEWDKFNKCYFQCMQLRNDYTSVVGRCVDTNGLAVTNADVEVRIVTTPTEVSQEFYKTHVGRTDKDGRWIVEGIDKPTFMFMLMRLSNTNVVDREDSRVPPYGIQVGAVVWSSKGIEAAAGVTIPNVTARDRAAAERIFAAYKRKTGKDWPRLAPMTDFPVSTNNVIYVPDIVLK